MNRDVTVDEVNAMLRDAANGELRGVLGYEERPLVSADYTNDTRSGIVDAPSTMVIDGRMVKVLVWYDNEYGYAHRLAEPVAQLRRQFLERLHRQRALFGQQRGDGRRHRARALQRTAHQQAHHAVGQLCHLRL